MAELNVRIDISNLEQFKGLCRLVQNAIVYLPAEQAVDVQNEFHRIIESLDGGDEQE